MRQDWEPGDRNGAAVTSLKRHSQGAKHPADQLVDGHVIPHGYGHVIPQAAIPSFRRGIRGQRA